MGEEGKGFVPSYRLALWRITNSLRRHRSVPFAANRRGTLRYKIDAIRYPARARHRCICIDIDSYDVFSTFNIHCAANRSSGRLTIVRLVFSEVL